MKFSLSTVLVLSLASEATLASSWFGKAGQYTFLKDASSSSQIPCIRIDPLSHIILDAEKALAVACVGAA